MKLAPLTRYAPPRYPTEAILRENPAFLTALPRRWRGNRLALGTLAGVLTLSAQWQALAQENAAASGSNPRVAPLFEHGKGQGRFGGAGGYGDVQFLTESEAREVIESEAKKAGLVFPKIKVSHKFSAVDIPVIDLFGRFWEPKRDVPKTRLGGLELDGYHPGKQIGYVFISTEKLHKWWEEDPAKEGGESFSINYDLVGTAQTLQASLAARKGKEKLAVFYDPITVDPALAAVASEIPRPEFSDRSNLTEEGKKAWDDYLKKRRDALKPAAEEDLRKQVRDFLEWLKAQGMM